MEQTLITKNIKVITSSHPLYTAVLELRNEVLRKPIGFNLYEEDLSKEINDIILVYQEDLQQDALLGCVVLHPSEEDKTKYQLRQMAVASEQRGKNIGRQLVEAAELYARKHNVATIYLHGRTVSVGFYLKCGYETISDEYLEKGIPHYTMQKHLS